MKTLCTTSDIHSAVQIPGKFATDFLEQNQNANRMLWQMQRAVETVRPASSGHFTLSLDFRFHLAMPLRLSISNCTPLRNVIPTSSNFISYYVVAIAYSACWT